MQFASAKFQVPTINTRALKLPRKTETYESAKCVQCNTRKWTNNGFVSGHKCRFYATGPWAVAK